MGRKGRPMYGSGLPHPIVGTVPLGCDWVLGTQHTHESLTQGAACMAPQFFSLESTTKERLIPYYHIAISCFWIDTHPISKISKKLLNGSSGWFAPTHLSLKHRPMSEQLRFPYIIFSKMFRHCLELFEVSWRIQS